VRKTLLVSALALVAPSAALGANFTFSVVTSSPVTLPAVTAGSWSCVAGCPVDPLPTGLTYPMTLSTTPQTIYNARAGTGHGKFYVASTFLVSYPAKTHAGTYRATITLSGSAGP
jgi:hypothetical protein